MNQIQKIIAAVGVMIPILGAVWWAGSGYMEFNDRLASLEREASGFHDLQLRYEGEQTENRIINERVEKLDKNVEMLLYHHHSVPQGGDTGRAHVD